MFHINFIHIFLLSKLISKLKLGDWGLGIGDWAQSPNPNPQSPNLLFNLKLSYIIKIN